MYLDPNQSQSQTTDAGQGTAQSGAGQQQQTSATAQKFFGSGSPDGGGQSAQQSAGAGQAPTGQGQGGAGGQAGSAPALTVEQIKQLAEEIRLGNQAGQQQQAPPQMTQEEFDRVFNVVRPTEAQWQLLRGEDPKAAVAALQEMLHGSVRQATTLAQFQLQQELQAVKAMIAPALKLAEQQELNQMKDEFFGSYPDLKGLEPLLLQIRDSFILQKKQFTNKEAAFKAVADEAKSLLAKIPGLQSGQGQQGNGTGQQSARHMPTLSGKGQGANSGGSSGQAMSTAKRIFG